MTSPATRGLPPSGIKKEGVLSGSYTSSSIGIAIPRKDSNGGARKDGIGFSSDEFLGMITHTPPAFSPGSLTMPLQKRGRSGSISSRLLSATDLEEKGLIDRYQKGVLKDMIISGDEALQKALEKFDAGDSTSLEGRERERERFSIDLV
jgi:hypothetical protein